MLDLSIYLSGKFNLKDLAVNMFVPSGKSKAYEILKKLAEGEV
jgi:hypothetical protein